jgi:hypothetical protein
VNHLKVVSEDEVKKLLVDQECVSFPNTTEESNSIDPIIFYVMKRDNVFLRVWSIVEDDKFYFVIETINICI